MSRAKGVSADEKKKRVLDYFYEKKCPFSLKELESQLPKAKGVISQSVKDVVQILQSEKFVESDKVGINQLYWVFPGKALKDRQSRQIALQNLLTTEKQKISEFQQKKLAAEKGREDTAERKEKEMKLSNLKEEAKKLDEELNHYRLSDPEFFKEILNGISIAEEAVGRWTDNIHAQYKSQREMSSGCAQEIEEWITEREYKPAELLEEDPMKICK